MYKIKLLDFFNKPQKTLVKVFTQIEPFDFRIGIRNVKKILNLFKTKYLYTKKHTYKQVFNEKHAYIFDILKLFDYINDIYIYQANINLKENISKWERKEIKMPVKQYKKLESLRDNLLKFRYPVYDKIKKGLRKHRKEILDDILLCRYDNPNQQSLIMSKLIIEGELDNKIKNWVKDNIEINKVINYFTYLRSIIKSKQIANNLQNRFNQVFS